MSDKQFVAKITATNVANGIVTFKLLHLGLDYTKLKFELVCVDNNKKTFFDHNTISKTQYKLLHVRVPLDVSDQKLSFKLRLKFIERVYQSYKKDVWFNYTDSETVLISSSLRAHQYKRNDLVRYRSHKQYSELDGYISSILDGDKINYFEITSCNDISNKSILHKSKIILPIISFNKVLDFQNQRKINKYLLCNSQINDYIISSHNLNAFNVYQTLLIIFESYSAMYAYSNQHINEYKYIAKYIGINVIQYLFRNDINALKYKSKCLKDGCNGNWLKISSLRNYMYLTYIKGLKDNLKPTDPLDTDCVYTCDVCMVSVSNWDWMYHCNTDNIADRHDCCIYCAYNMIQRHEQLLQLLKEILIVHNMVFDCIQEIASFITGNDVVARRA